MTRERWLPACAAALLAACATETPVAPAPAPAQTDPVPIVAAARSESQRLHELFDAYFEQQLQLDPMLATSIGDPRYNDRYEVQISPEWRARAERAQRDALAALATIDRSTLTGQDLLSYDVFKSARELDIEGFRFPRHLMPLNQFYSTPNDFAQMGSGKGIHPFKTVKDYDDFLKRLDGFVAWTDQAIANMREGAAKGYTLPRVLAERTLPQLEAHIVATPEESIYHGPISNLPPTFAAGDRERLKAAYRSAIVGKVVPTYRRLHDFMRDEYLPKCRTTVGLDVLPDGAAWYAYNVRRITTTDYTPRADPRHRPVRSRAHPRRDPRRHAAGRVQGRRQGVLGVHAGGPAVLLYRPRRADRGLRGHQAAGRPGPAAALRAAALGGLRSAGGRAVPREERRRRQLPGGNRGRLAAGHLLRECL